MSSIILYDEIFTHLSRPEYEVHTSSPYDHHAHHAVPSSATDRHYRHGRSVHTLPVTSPTHPPQPLVLQLLHWVPGRTMASFSSPPPIHALADAGWYLDRVCTALDYFTTTNDDDDDSEGRKNRKVRECEYYYRRGWGIGGGSHRFLSHDSSGTRVYVCYLSLILSTKHTYTRVPEESCDKNR